MKYLNLIALSATFFISAFQDANAQQNQPCQSCPASSVFTLTCGAGQKCSGNNGVTPLMAYGYWGGSTNTIVSSAQTTLTTDNPTLGFDSNGHPQCTYQTSQPGVTFSAATIYAPYKGKCTYPPATGNQEGCTINQFDCSSALSKEKSKATKKNAE